MHGWNRHLPFHYNLFSKIFLVKGLKCLPLVINPSGLLLLFTIPTIKISEISPLFR